MRFACVTRQAAVLFPFERISRVCKSFSRLQVQLRDRKRYAINFLQLVVGIAEYFPFGCLIVAALLIELWHLILQPIGQNNGVAKFPHLHHIE
jgi:hypothetical protein